jgi:hypothetical protein
VVVVGVVVVVVGVVVVVVVVGATTHDPPFQVQDELVMVPATPETLLLVILRLVPTARVEPDATWKTLSVAAVNEPEVVKLVLTLIP